LIAAERFDATIDSITLVSAQRPSLSATCALASGDKGACCGSLEALVVAIFGANVADSKKRLKDVQS
jgi:hypothetical protein